MNLGGAFAGGLARGIETRQAFDERKTDNEFNRNLRGRQMQMHETEFANHQADRASAEALKKQMADIVPKWYGEQEIEDGEAFDDDGQGNITRIPIKKKVKFTPGMDATRDIGFMGDMMRVSMASGKYDPAQFQGAWETAQKMRKTELGANLEGVLRGDKAALGKFLALKGLPAEGAKLSVDVKNGTAKIILGDGKPLDLEPDMMTFAKGDVFENLLAARKSASEIALRQSQVDENKAKTTQLIPAQVAAQRASASSSAANAEYTRTAKTNLTDAKTEATATKGAKIPTKTITDAIFDPGAQAAATTYAQSLTKSGKTPDVAAMEAVDLYQKIRAAAAKDPGLKAKGYTPDQAAAAKMKQMAGG